MNKIKENFKGEAKNENRLLELFRNYWKSFIATIKGTHDTLITYRFKLVDIALEDFKALFDGVELSLDEEGEGVGNPLRSSSFEVVSRFCLPRELLLVDAEVDIMNAEGR